MFDLEAREEAQEDTKRQEPASGGWRDREQRRGPAPRDRGGRDFCSGGGGGRNFGGHRVRRDEGPWRRGGGGGERDFGGARRGGGDRDFGDRRGGGGPPYRGPRDDDRRGRRDDDRRGPRDDDRRVHRNDDHRPPRDDGPMDWRSGPRGAPRNDDDCRGPISGVGSAWKREEEERRKDEIAKRGREEREVKEEAGRQKKAREEAERQKKAEEDAKRQAELEIIERKKREKEREIEEKLAREREKENRQASRSWQSDGVGGRQDDCPRGGREFGGDRDHEIRDEASKSFKRNRDDLDVESDKDDEEKVTFRCSDIRYRSKEQQPVIKKTSLSILISSHNSQSLKKFTNNIRNIRRFGCSYASESTSNALVVRMDYVFTTDTNLKMFKNKIAQIEKAQDLVMEMKIVSEDVLLHKVAPILSEPEMLSVCGGNTLLDNIFRGFTIEVLEEAGKVIKFKFQNMSELNLFLASNTSFHLAFLGLVRQRNLSRLISIKKFRYTFYPLRVKIQGIDLKNVLQSYKYKLFKGSLQIQK